MDPISPDLPELRLLAQMAGVAPLRIAEAFNDPEHVFKHITLEELNRLTAAATAIATLSERLMAATSIAADSIKKALSNATG